ncbi:MAG: TPM domain-containing protein [Clostridia bacterium]|nr:TPM domain-containing protein [Clostridia bacterium]
MKRFFALLSAVALALSLSANAFAFSSDFVVDNADLLSEGEEVILADIIGKINFEHDINVVIHTTEDTDGLYIEDYADNFYDNGSYYSDGLVFVISMAERDYYTSTCGYLVDSMPAYDIDSICEPVVPYLSNAQYYEAFEIYLKRLDSYLNGDFSYDSDYGEGVFAGDYYTDDEYYYDDYDGDYIYTSGSSSITDSVFAREIILIIVAVIIAVVITMFLKSKMNTAVKKYDADDYVVNGSFNLEISRDAFVGSHTTRRAIPKNNNTGSRPGGGGGGVRVSSGGARHGGSGGKF